MDDFVCLILAAALLLLVILVQLPTSHARDYVVVSGTARGTT